MSEFECDVFISYSHADQEWVRNRLLPSLESAGLKVIIDYRDFEVGTPSLVNIERAVDGSRHTLVVLTPDWVAGEWTEFESLLAGTADPAGRRRKLIPLKLKPCDLPPRIAMLTYADLTDPDTRDEQMARVLRGLGIKARVFISYKRDYEPDDPLATRLRAALEQAGHTVFIDQKLKPGVDWALKLEEQIKACDFFLVLLSSASVNSEMVAKETECARRNNEATGKSRPLPVRVGFDDALPYPIASYLDPIQYVKWNGEADDEPLIRQLLNAISDFEPFPAGPAVTLPGETQIAASHPYADPRFLELIADLPDPSGALDRHSEFYIERDQDARLARELRKPRGITATIRAPRQTGKSSLLIRGIAQAQAKGRKVAFIDLQPISDRTVQDLDSFLYHFSTTILSRLRLDPSRLEKIWQSPLDASTKTTRVMEEVVLAEVEDRIVLAVDEADRLLETEFHNSVFGLMRSWHNARALDDRWNRLDIVMVISSEPHLLIEDVRQSPFNVGITLRLKDFNQAQVGELNRRYRSPLDEGEVASLVDHLGGHPYLVHRALYTLISEQITWPAFIRDAAGQGGPFGDHLRRYLWLLRDEEELRRALKAAFSEGRCPDEVSYYRLMRAGLIVGPSRQQCAPRCKLYATYFKDKL